MECTDEHKKAIKLVQQGKNVLITGSAGTGKTTLLKEIIDMFDKDQLLLLAPTGVSALQLPNGYTIHSGLKLPIDSSNPEAVMKYYLKQWYFLEHNNKKQVNEDWYIRLKQANTLIIDEVSMVSAHMLEVIDIILGIVKDNRKTPFGGMQVIFVGDFLQLPPVYNPKGKAPIEQSYMAFKSSVWTALDVQKIQLTKVFRQEDQDFALLLNAIRTGVKLTGTLQKQFKELLEKKMPQDVPDALYICYKKDDVNQINERKTHELLQQDDQENNEYSFPYYVMSKDATENEDMIKIVGENLGLVKSQNKQVFVKGMRVMSVRNFRNLDGLKIVNGDTGTIVGFCKPPSTTTTNTTTNGAVNSIDSSDSFSNIGEYKTHVSYLRYEESNPEFFSTLFPLVQFDRFKDQVCVLPVTWSRQELHKQTGEVMIKIEIDAVPLIPAWAITSHRAQGTTIANIPIQINADCMNFAEGGFYVAISRCRKQEQLFITNYKGYRQSKDAIEFYENRIKLEKAKVYDNQVMNLLLYNENFFNQCKEMKREVIEEDKKQETKTIQSHTGINNTTPLKNQNQNHVRKTPETLTSFFIIDSLKTYSIQHGSQKSLLVEPLLNALGEDDVIEQVEKWLQGKKRKLL